MSRVDDLLDNRLVLEVKDIIRDIEELKTRQFTGSNNLIIYLNQTSNTWDIEELITLNVLYIRWRVTFTPDTVDQPFTQLQYDVVGESFFNTFYSYPDPANESTSTVSFLVEMSNSDIDDWTLRFKFVCKSLDTGIITVTELERRTIV